MSIAAISLALLALLHQRFSVPPQALDSLLFARAVEMIRDSTFPGVQLEISPYPLLGSPAVMDGSVEDRAVVSLSILEARRAVLRETRIVEAASASRGLCPGFRVWGANFEHCPSQAIHRIAVGLARDGGARLSRVDVLADGATDGAGLSGVDGKLASLRVIRTELSPKGAWTLVGDVVFRFDGGAWKLWKWVGLMYIE